MYSAHIAGLLLAWSRHYDAAITDFLTFQACAIICLFHEAPVLMAALQAHSLASELSLIKEVARQLQKTYMKGKWCICTELHPAELVSVESKYNAFTMSTYQTYSP